MKYKVTLNNRVYEVEVEEGQAMLVDEYELAAPAAPAPAVVGDAPAEPAVADIPDIPDMPAVAPFPAAAPMSAADGEKDVPAIVSLLGTIVQVAACIAMGALAWFLYQDALIF